MVSLQSSQPAIVDDSLVKEFVNLIRAGAGSRDIHDASPDDFAGHSYADEKFVQRELDRVALHQRSLCRLLEKQVTDIDAALDVGCGTGGTTVAIALSTTINAKKLVGIDPDHTAIAASRIRARAYGLEDRTSFFQVDAGAPLPFNDNQFSLVTCISVLEFISDPVTRIELVHELCRVTAPGGFIVICTPSPLRLREYHSHRFLGNLRRKAGFPWSSTPRHLRKMFQDCDVTFLFGEQIALALSRHGMPGARLAARLPAVPLLLPWQKILARKSMNKRPAPAAQNQLANM